LLKPLLVLSYFSNLKSHLKISEKDVIKQYCVYNLVLLQYMTYFTFVTACWLSTIDYQFETWFLVGQFVRCLSSLYV